MFDTLFKNLYTHILSRRRRDNRTRRDRTQRRIDTFAQLLPDMTTAYMHYRAKHGNQGWMDLSVEDPPDMDTVKFFEIQVVDIFGKVISN